MNISQFKINLSLLFLALLCVVNISGAQTPAWSYPAIPYTDWAYDPFTIEPIRPVQWPTSGAENFYYVEQNHPSASDDAIKGELIGSYGRFGYPDRPRLTIPSASWIGNVYIAGTVIWIKGGEFTNQNFYPNWSPQLHGTDTQPVWIYGDPQEPPVLSGVKIQLYNSQYAILDNLHWIGNNHSNGVLSMTRDRPGPTHHITLKNLRFENLPFIAGGGAIVGLTSSDDIGAELHDVVAYKNVFKNNGGGFDWSTDDNDHHGYKINGLAKGNATYRIWIIDNQAVVGDQADPVDGLFKSLSGNLIQVGDQNASSGNNHHIFAAGNYQEFARQALGWTKKSHDVIFSSNYCTNTYNLSGGNGQCYGHQYSLGDYNWWINNVATQSASGWMHTSNDQMSGPLFVIGNLFYNNRDGEANDNWRTCSGITLFNQRGVHYIVNNVIDDSCHGIWAATNRHINSDELYIYNNIISNISATIDTSSRAITLTNSNDLQLFLGNNLFSEDTNQVKLNNSTYADINALNQQVWAQSNISGNPEFMNVNNNNYILTATSPAVDQGTQTYPNNAVDPYQLFINRYDNDPNYPGDPSEYWPQDYSGFPRVSGPQIDIGAHEYDFELTDLIFSNNFE